MKNKQGFTLAEVLITLGIIGVVASLTIPILMNSINDNQYKTAYKKAYSDITNVFYQPISEKEMPMRTSGGTDYVATTEEWNILKSGLKVAKDCTVAQLSECWVAADLVCTGACAANAPQTGNNSLSFVDGAGRSWAMFHNGTNIYLVDTNGNKTPNKFGKDRWMFDLEDASGARVSNGTTEKVGIQIKSDVVGAATDWCKYPPCYYYSWLYQ